MPFDCRLPSPTAGLGRCCAGICLAVGVFLIITGCAGAVSRHCPAPTEIRYAAVSDSLGLAAFLDLPSAQRAERRAAAEMWRRRAPATASPATQAQALTNAAGLAPDNADTWLRLAQVWRWYGDYLTAFSCLEEAAAATRQRVAFPTDARARRQVTLRVAILRAWLHYDRAEWQEGVNWAEAALQLESGNASALQVMGLLQGAQGRQSRARAIADEMTRVGTHLASVQWIRAVLELGLGRERAAFSHAVSLRPDKSHAAECYRDLGRIAERLGEWSRARLRYAESAAALPLGDGSCLTRIVHPRLEPGGESSKLPFWLAFDRYFVTGSLSAYTAFALSRFDHATDAAERTNWASAVINAAGIHQRQTPGRPWALRARGLVFARTDMEQRALADLRRAATLLAAEGLADHRVEAELGHLLLMRDDPRVAEGHLRRALALDDAAAGAWADLGVVLVKLGDATQALTALDTAIRLDPGSPTAWYNRGLLHLHAGRHATAVSDLERAANLAPDNHEVARLLQQLRREIGRTEATPGNGEAP